MVNRSHPAKARTSPVFLKLAFRRDGELRDLGGGVCVADLVGEVHADLLQDVRWNLAEVDFVGLVLAELSGSGQHGLYGAGGESVVALDDELVAVRRDQFDIHGLRSFAAPVDLAAAVSAGTSGLHGLVGGHSRFLLQKGAEGVFQKTDAKAS